MAGGHHHTTWSFETSEFLVWRDTDLVVRVPVPVIGSLSVTDYWDGAERAAVICDALNHPGPERERMLTELGLR